MIICKDCGEETKVAIKNEFLCFACYDQRAKAQAKAIRLPKTVYKYRSTDTE